MANNKQRYVNTRFWNDGFISELDPIEKLLFIYFLTNEHTNIAGIYEIPLKIVGVETGIDKSMLEKILPRLNEKINYVDGFVVIKNALKHQKSANPSVQIGITNCLDELDKNFLKTLLNKGLYTLNDSDPTDSGVTPSNSYLDSHSDSNSDLESNPRLDELSLTTTQVRAQRMNDPRWLAFWEAYPRKQGKEKAMVKFANIPKKQIPKIMEALAIHKTKWRDPQFIPMPATWLFQQRWEDEVVTGTMDPIEAEARALIKQFPPDNDTTAQFRFSRKYGNQNLLRFKHLFNL